MTTPADPNGSGSAQDPDAIREDIERTRADLADTVDALQAKVDVKHRAQAKAHELKTRLTTSAGKPRPELVGGVAAAVLLAVGLAWWRRR
jgi:Protein of unknown function (DUF3618)